MGSEEDVDLKPIAGMRLATAALGDVYKDRPNLLLAAFDPGTAVAGVLTRSTTAAAPVRWTRARLAAGAAPRALVVNAGNANCFTGKTGDAAVEQAAAMVGEIVGCDPGEVFVASTGRIGQPLDMAAYERALREAGQSFAAAGWQEAARAIMTTDSFPKAAKRELAMNRGTVLLHGITKGSTMIAPHMATTLSFVFTDAAASPDDLHEILRHASDRTYNRITVDNTQSTNDTILLFATGGASQPDMTNDKRDRESLASALEALLQELSDMIVQDAGQDGIVVRISISGAETETAAVCIGRAVANSYLIRRDIVTSGALMPGRIVAAIGMAEEAVAVDRLMLTLGGELVSREGQLLSPPTVDIRPLIRAGVLDIDIDIGVSEGAATIRTVAV